MIRLSGEPVQTGVVTLPPDAEKKDGLKFDGIKGESLDGSHQDWVQILPVVSPPTKATTSSQSSTAAPGPVSTWPLVDANDLHAAARTHAAGVTEFTFTKQMDASSNRLVD